MYSTYNALHALHLILLKEIVILLFKNWGVTRNALLFYKSF